MKDCKLVADYNNGEGKIELSERFNSADCLLRADILKDWIYDLTNAYNKALEEMRAGAQPSQEDTTGLCTVREWAEKLTVEWDGMNFYPDGEMVFNHNGRKYTVEMKVIEAKILPAVYNTPRVIQ